MTRLEDASAHVDDAIDALDERDRSSTYTTIALVLLTGASILIRTAQDQRENGA